MSTTQFDVVVIGAGPAGYVAAIRCAQLGLRVACIDQWRNANGQPRLGGTCLNAGCIPSKALLESSEHFAQLSHLAEHGITTGPAQINIQQMQTRKSRIVDELTQGIAILFKANQITWVPGQGQLLPNKRIQVTSATGSITYYHGQHIILASGSYPLPIAAAPLDHELIIDSTGALALPEVPPRLGIIGAGVIGLELGSVWQRLGSQVTLLEAQNSFLSMVDPQISREALRQLKRQGLTIELGARVTATQRHSQQVSVTYQMADTLQELTVDRLIVAVGRAPATAQLSAPETGLLLDERGFIHVDEHCNTNLPGIYAIGDVVRGPMLAHKGSEEGIMVAERIAGEPTTVNYATIPAIIYTNPEIAWVGQNETQLTATGIAFNKGTFAFAANGRAKAAGQTQGLCKILASQENDRILGVHILGNQASELIGEAVLAMEFGASSEDLARTIHAHPSLSEALHEAALAVAHRAIHKVNS